MIQTTVTLYTIHKVSEFTTTIKCFYYFFSIFENKTNLIHKVS